MASAQVEVGTYILTVQQPELSAVKGTQVMLPEHKNSRVQTSPRTKTIGTYSYALLFAYYDA